MTKSAKKEREREREGSGRENERKTDREGLEFGGWEIEKEQI